MWVKAFMTSSTPRVIRFVLGFAGRAWSAGLLLSIFASSLLDLVGIAIIFPYLKVVMDEQAQAKLLAWLPLSWRGLGISQLLVGLSLLLIVTYLIKSLCQALLLRFQNRRLATLTTRFTDDTVSRLLQARYALYLQFAGSDMGATAFASPMHATLVYRSLLQIANELLFVSLMFLIFLCVSPIPTLTVVALLLVVGVLLYLTVIRNTSRLGRQQSETENARYRLLFSIINAVRDIKVMGLAKMFEAISREVSLSFENMAWRYNFNHALPMLVIEVTVLVGVVGTVMGIILAKIDISQALPVVGVVAVSAVRLVPAVAKLFMSLNTLRFYTDSVARFEALRSQLIEARHEKKADALQFTQRIELQGIGFSYGDRVILEDISLCIEPGRSYGIVGPSGSGKSTLLDVFTGLQSAQSGRFSCDGQAFDPFTSASMAKLIGYVPQRITLIDESIAFNISFEHQPDPVRLSKALAMANLDSLIAALPEGLRTRVGENGARLSGGQQQRIGIARACYREPRILVLDEATSALDALTEREIEKELTALRDRVATLTVSHRISAVEDCDEIIVLAHGRIVGRGRHTALLEQCPLYRELHQLQNIAE